MQKAAMKQRAAGASSNQIYSFCVDVGKLNY